MRSRPPRAWGWGSRKVVGVVTLEVTAKGGSESEHVEINQGLTVVHPNPDQEQKSPSEGLAVDIVAVTGFRASPEWTWRSNNKVDWLGDRNMLARTIINARIMIFEYES